MAELVLHQGFEFCEDVLKLLAFIGGLFCEKAFY